LVQIALFAYVADVQNYKKKFGITGTLKFVFKVKIHYNKLLRLPKYWAIQYAVKKA